MNRRIRPAASLVGRFCAMAALIAVGFAFAQAAQGQTGGAPGSPDQAERAPLALALLFVSLLAVSGLVSGSETAIFSLTKVDLARVRSRKSRSGRSLLNLIDHPNDTLTALLVLNNLFNVGLSLTAGALMEVYFASHSVVGFALASFGATSFLLVFGEVLPKRIAHLKAGRLAPLVAGPLAAISAVMLPLRWVMNAFIKIVFAKLEVAPTTMNRDVTQDEIRAMLNTDEASSVLEEDEREMIRGVFELERTFAEEIMVPRTAVTALSADLDQAQMVERLREIKHNRVLIHRENLDELEGFVLTKEILLEPGRPWKHSIREMLCVPLRARLDDLLAQFRRNSTKIAAVVDEYGGVAGIVTLHDLLEEIVGEMIERNEPMETEFREIEENRWIASGHMNLSELGEKIEVGFPDDRGTTVGGFVMNTLGAVPEPQAELEHDGMIFKVTRMSARRITEVEISRQSAAPPDAAAPRGEAV